MLGSLREKVSKGLAPQTLWVSWLCILDEWSQVQGRSQVSGLCKKAGTAICCITPKEVRGSFCQRAMRLSTTHDMSSRQAEQNHTFTLFL